MKIKLMNSAVMSCEGKYSCKKITKNEFIETIKKAGIKNIESFIGYPQNIEFLRKWTGFDIPLSREETKLKNGDIMLAMVLNYRLMAGKIKGTKVEEKHFNFFEIKYQK